MKILTKLIIALSLTSFLILSALFAVMQWSFDRGMLDYVNQKQIASLQLFSENLAKFYQQGNTWQPLLAKKQHRPRERSPEHSPRHAQHPVNGVKRNRERGPPSATWLHILTLSEQGGELPDDVDLYLKDEQFSVTSGSQNAIKDRQRRFGPRMPPPRPHNDFSSPPEENNIGLKPTLLDRNKDILIGRFDENFSVKSIKLDGSIVGYLALPPTKHLSDAFDLAFIEETQQNLIYTLSILFALISIIALPLS